MSFSLKPSNSVFGPSTVNGSETVNGGLTVTGGNVGIGQASADEKLMVGGAIRSTAQAVSWGTQLSALMDYSGNNARFVAAAPAATSNGMQFWVTSGGTLINGLSILNSGVVSAISDVNIGNANNTSATLTFGGAPTLNGSCFIKLATSSTQKNWKISTNDSIAGAFEIAQSTLAGGTTWASPVFMIDSTGTPKFAGTNTTGAGSAALGANCPAVTVTAPYTWVKILTADGSTAYVPAWK